MIAPEKQKLIKHDCLINRINHFFSMVQTNERNLPTILKQIVFSNMSKNTIRQTP